MIDVPSSTWFTAPPHWGWYIVLYFFFGGLAGGSYFLAALTDLIGRPGDRPLARLGYYVAFPLVLLCGLLLIVDLNRPLRFWHMLIESQTFGLMFKPWSPMSVGAWALLIFGIFSFLSFLAALAEEDRIRWAALRRIRWPALRRLRPPYALGTLIAILGGVSGLFLAGYTGILLAVTNRPIWSDTPLLGLLFIISAASTSAALLSLLAYRAGWRMPALFGLQRMDGWLIGLELLVLVALLISLGPVFRAWLNAWGLLLLVGVIVGLLVPLGLSWRQRRIGELNVATTAVLVLLGGFLLRAVVVFSAEAI